MGEPSQEPHEEGAMAVSEADDFNFEDWAKGNCLNRKTVAFLRSEDLNTFGTLQMLESGDLRSFPLTVGQSKLLARAIRDIKTVSHHADGPVETPGTQGHEVAATAVDREPGITIQEIRKQTEALDMAGKSLDELLNPSVVAAKVPASAVNTGFDPRSILTLKSGTKTVHVTQFLSEKTRKRRISRRREVVVPSVDNNGDTIVVQREDAQPYSGIFQSEWGAANCRLMHHLLSNGLLARQDIEYYLAYTAKIFDFADKYEWESILEFDFLYRERQAEHRFPWGSLAPDMELHVLTAKRRPPTGSHVQSPGSVGSNDHVNVGECRLFKARGVCPFGRECKYKHVKTSNTPHVGEFSKKQ